MMSLTKKSLSGVRVRLAANIYKPNELSAKHKLSGILLVPGWAVSKVNLKNNYGPHFAKLGFIVLAFDYKSWGQSDGPVVPTEAFDHSKGATKLDINVTQIRKIVEPMSMLADVRAALYYLSGNFGLWGRYVDDFVREK